MKIIDILTSPWAIVPAKLHEIQEIYSVHLRGERTDLKAIEAQIGRPLNNEQRGYEVIDGVAVIPIEGVLAKKMNIFADISGGTSYQLIERDVRAALQSPLVKAILLDIDSPGGTVDGVQGVSNTIFEARKQKPILAWSDGAICSAAYWLASAADRIFIAGDTVQVGSIGVVAEHRDFSKAEEQRGIKTTEVVAGKYKRVASKYAPLSEEGRASIQEAVNHVYTAFVGDVARNRGATVETVLEEMADGRIFMGQRAVQAGLVDGISTKERLILRFAQTSSAQTLSPEGGRYREKIESHSREAREMKTEERFENLAEKYQVEHRCKRTEAIKAIAIANPEAHAEYIARVNNLTSPSAGSKRISFEQTEGEFESLVREYAGSHGVSTTTAIREIAIRHPQVHEAYIKRVNGLV